MTSFKLNCFQAHVTELVELSKCKGVVHLTLAQVLIYFFDDFHDLDWLILAIDQWEATIKVHFFYTKTVNEKRNQTKPYSHSVFSFHCSIFLLH